MLTKFTDEKSNLKSPKYFYEVEFNKPGGNDNAYNCWINYDDDKQRSV
jgi:hypothetical protein